MVYLTSLCMIVDILVIICILLRYTVFIKIRSNLRENLFDLAMLLICINDLMRNMLC